jgi:hypothetical protein
MNDTTKNALNAMERLLDHGAVSSHAAITAAYQLGKFDGQLQMASVAQEKVKDLLKEAA